MIFGNVVSKQERICRSLSQEMLTSWYAPRLVSSAHWCCRATRLYRFDSHFLRDAPTSGAAVQSQSGASVRQMVAVNRLFDVPCSASGRTPRRARSPQTFHFRRQADETSATRPTNRAVPCVSHMRSHPQTSSSAAMRCTMRLAHAADARARILLAARTGPCSGMRRDAFELGTASSWSGSAFRAQRDLGAAHILIAVLLRLALTRRRETRRQ
jgi:hypothetical protein